MKMEDFAQIFKQALYENACITETLSDYKRLVISSPQTAVWYFANTIMNTAFGVFADLLKDFEKQEDIKWGLIYDSDSERHTHDVEIKCKFYRRVEKEYEHCTTLIMNCCFCSYDYEVVYRRVVMLDKGPWYGKNDKLKEVQLMKQYLSDFRNVLFEIIKEIQPEMVFTKR